MSTNLPIIRKNGFFTAILANSDTLEGVCGEYLVESQENRDSAPNIAGLCARLGTTPQALRKLFALPETDESAPPSESMHILANTIMQIEDATISGGLTGKFNAHMAKFILSAFHERHEKRLEEHQSDNRVTITVEAHTPIDLEELRELDRLEKAIEAQEKDELQAMGRLPVAEDNDEAMV